jgi:hypothetical protein
MVRGRIGNSMNLSELELPTCIEDLTMYKLAGDTRSVYRMISEFIRGNVTDRGDLRQLPINTQKYFLLWLRFNLWAVENIKDHYNGSVTITTINHYICQSYSSNDKSKIPYSLTIVVEPRTHHEIKTLIETWNRHNAKVDSN